LDRSNFSLYRCWGSGAIERLLGFLIWTRMWFRFGVSGSEFPSESEVFLTLDLICFRPRRWIVVFRLYTMSLLCSFMSVDSCLSYTWTWLFINFIIIFFYAGTCYFEFWFHFLKLLNPEPQISPCQDLNPEPSTR